MEKPIYKVWFAKYTESYYRLSKEEQVKLGEAMLEAQKQLGVKTIVACNTFWANEEWIGWGVEQFPNLEVLQEFENALVNMNWFAYYEAKTYLGTEMPQV
jgi:hypothetical protein